MGKVDTGTRKETESPRQWVLNRAQGLRVLLLILFGTACGLAGWALHTPATSSDALRTPQYVEVYISDPSNVANSSNAAQVHLTVAVRPVRSRTSRKTCSLADSTCVSAIETLTLIVTPYTSEPVQWLMVVDDPKVDSVERATRQTPILKETSVYKATRSHRTNGDFGEDVLSASDSAAPQASLSGTTSDTYTWTFWLSNAFAHSSDTLTAELPQIFNEADPQVACGIQVVYQGGDSAVPALDRFPEVSAQPGCSNAGSPMTTSTSNVDAQTSTVSPPPAITSSSVSTAAFSSAAASAPPVPPAPPPPPPALCSPGSGLTVVPIVASPSPTCFYSPATVFAAETLLGETDPNGFRTDADSGGSPTTSGYEWSATTYGLQPELLETDVIKSDQIQDDQFRAGILLGIFAACALGLLQELKREEKRRPVRAVPQTEA